MLPWPDPPWGSILIRKAVRRWVFAGFLINNEFLCVRLLFTFHSQNKHQRQPAARRHHLCIGNRLDCLDIWTD